MDSAHHLSLIFIELGAVSLGLAIVARIANWMGLSSIPLYLIAGLCFGKGGLVPLDLSSGFTHFGGEIGVLLLLFMLGLEYTGDQLRENLRRGFPSGVVDFVLNFPPGLIAGFILGWSPMAAVLLGGVTYISSSGVIAKVLEELHRLDSPETPSVLAVLVLEDLAMAVYLPIVAVLLVGGDTHTLLVSVGIAMVTVLVVLIVAIRFGRAFSRLVSHDSEEILLLTTFGSVLLVAGLAQRLQVCAAVGAFLVGIAISGPLVERSHRLLAPLRDLFAATFFFFFGLQIDPHSLPKVLPFALVLGAVTALTKVGTGYWAARHSGVDGRGGMRAGAALIARGEFSIVIAGLGAAVEPRIEPLSAAYVLLLAILGPILTRLIK